MNKIHRLQNLLFLLVIGLLPFNARYVFNFQSIQQIESFRENITFSFFAFDLPIIALVILISFEAYQIYMHSLKIDQVTYEMREYEIKPRHLRYLLKNPFTYYFFALTLTAILAHNQLIAFYNSFRLFQSAAFFLVAVFLFNNRKRMLNYAAMTLFVSGIFQSIIAIFQFLLQHSLGLGFLGESSISTKILGVAKFEFAGEKFIRAYGTFPHPNLLGYFLLIALACGIWIAIKKNQRVIPPLAATSGSIVIICGLLLSYSRSIITATAILLAIIIFKYRKQMLGFYCKCCEYFKIPSIVQGAVAILLFFTSLFVVYNLLAPRLCIKQCPGDYSFQMREIYNRNASNIITTHPFFGVGAGNFVSYLLDHHQEIFKPWEFQPAHNIYFLITAELGIVGLITFLTIIAFLLVKSGFSARKHYANPFVILFFLSLLIGFVDHYQWTLIQGQMLFWIVLAFFAAISNRPLFER